MSNIDIAKAYIAAVQTGAKGRWGAFCPRKLSGISRATTS
jgi:hypothetical protein